MQAAAWGVTGAALSCYEIALNHSTRISEFGRPIAESQAYQGSLADMAGHIVTSQLLSLHYGRCSEMQQLSPLQVEACAEQCRHGRLYAKRPALSP